MRFFPLITILILYLFSACGNDSPLSKDATVSGSWKLKRAMRNNAETSTLDGLFYEFKDDGTVITNLMSDEATKGNYTWEGAELATEGVNLPLTYTVKELTDSTLNLQSKYRGYQFNFELIRKE